MKKIKENDMLHLVPPVEPIRTYFYSKDFNETKVYTCLDQIVHDFGKDNILVMYASIVFKYNNYLCFTNNIEDIERFSLVAIDSTIGTPELKKLYEAKKFLILVDTFKECNFITKDTDDNKSKN